MKSRKVALSLYIIASFLAILATVFHSDIVMLLSKPAVIPAILFYYLAIKRGKTVNVAFLFVLVLNFIGDTLVLLEIEDTKIIMIPYFLSYLILLKFAVDDVRKIGFNLTGLLLSVFAFSFLMYIMFALIQLFADTHQELVIPVIIYGIVLGTFAAIAVYCFYTKYASFTFYMLVAALLSIVSDVFYIMFSLIYHFASLNYFEFTIQLASYFFIVKYFVLRRN